MGLIEKEIEAIEEKGKENIEEKKEDERERERGGYINGSKSMTRRGG